MKLNLSNFELSLPYSSFEQFLDLRLPSVLTAKSSVN